MFKNQIMLHRFSTEWSNCNEGPLSCTQGGKHDCFQGKRTTQIEFFCFTTLHQPINWTTKQTNKTQKTQLKEIDETKKWNISIQIGYRFCTWHYGDIKVLDLTEHVMKYGEARHYSHRKESSIKQVGECHRSSSGWESVNHWGTIIINDLQRGFPDETSRLELRLGGWAVLAPKQRRKQKQHSENVQGTFFFLINHSGFQGYYYLLLFTHHKYSYLSWVMGPFRLNSY